MSAVVRFLYYLSTHISLIIHYHRIERTQQIIRNRYMLVPGQWSGDTKIKPYETLVSRRRKRGWTGGEGGPVKVVFRQVFRKLLEITRYIRQYY